MFCTTMKYSPINFPVVVHGRMQDLPRGANYLFFFWGGGGLATRGVAMRLLGGFEDMLPRKKNFNGAFSYFQKV